MTDETEREITLHKVRLKNVIIKFFYHTDHHLLCIFDA